MKRSDKEEKQGILKRTGNWGARKVLPESTANQARKTFATSIRGALDNLKPNKVNPEELRSGYVGRYTDGGRARFETMAHERGLRDQDLERLYVQNRQMALIFLVASAAGFIFGLYMMFTEEQMVMILGGASTCIIALTFLALAIRFDFSSWQIRNRRFGGFREFLETRL